MSDERETLIVTSKTKAFIKSQGCMLSSDAIGTINDKVHEMLEKAVERTKANKRSTLRPQDL